MALLFVLNNWYTGKYGENMIATNLRKFRLMIMIFSFVGILFPTTKGYSQKILTDTFFIDFPIDTLIELKGICIEKIKDKRSEDPHFVRYNTRNKYLLFPIDEEVHLNQPLSDALTAGTACNDEERHLQLEIDNFMIEKQRGRFSSSLILQADLPVYENMGDTVVYRGTYFYNYVYMPRSKKESLDISTQNILRRWHTEFKLDLLSLKVDSFGLSNQSASFLPDKAAKSLYLHTSVSGFAGFNAWGFQGEMYFMRPETQPGGHYVAGIFRYMNYNEYESFAIGKQSEHFFFRNNSPWVGDLDFNFLIGFCKWKDIEKYEPKLYQLFDIGLSSVQSLVYDQKNKQGITFRLGAIESFNYIIERKPKFFAGLIVGIGFKI